MKNEKPLRILMLEDSHEDIALIERLLTKSMISFIAVHVDTREEFIKAITEFKPDVVLSDHGLPQFNSREALKICLQERSFVPFILVTGTVSDEFAISCLREGADDYILKSNLSRLPLAINRAIKEKKLDAWKREARHTLRRKNEELTKVNKELDSFVYSVSHNLRGPLASVSGLLNIARREDIRKKFDSIHSMMAASIKKLDETLKEILIYSTNARAVIQSETIDWSLLIAKSWSKLEYLDNFKQIKFIVELSVATPFHSDFHRLDEILTSLFSNSIHFIGTTREARITIAVSTSFEAATIIVKDNGIGIPAEILPKIFDMFYRGTEESQGAGLGLYITREIVRKLKGEIKIVSVAGKETEAIIVIPNTSILNEPSGLPSLLLPIVPLCAA